MPFTSTTRLRLRSWRFYAAFFVQSFRSALQARAAEGSIAISVLNDSHLTFWTRTVWNDEQAMRKYMSSGVHRGVMTRLPNWCDEAAVVHWIQDSRELPSWDESHQRLQAQGRTSRVNQPSEAQRTFQIPPPKLSRFRELRFK